MRKSLFLLIMLMIAGETYSEEIVFNKEGSRILLKDDHTWVVLEEKSSTTARFRNSSWGMTVEEVKKTETTQAKYETNAILVYSDNLLGFNADVVYIFAKNKLIRSKYIFRNEHSNTTDFITDYLKIKSSLASKYGKVKIDKQVWKNDLYKSDPPQWGMAIAVGHLKYYSQWEDQDSSVFLYLTGENYKIEFGIEYSSIKYKDLESQQEQEETSSKL